jgi:hypothetical protein
MTLANGCRDDGLASFGDSCSHALTSNHILQVEIGIYKSIIYYTLRQQREGKKKANRERLAF